MDKNELTEEYIIELFHVAFKKDNFFEILVQHLKYSYLTIKAEKEFWQKAVQLYKIKNKIPSLGVVQVQLRKNSEVQDLIIRIKEKEIEDYILVIDSFQDFVKESMFVEIFEKSGELYNRNEEKEAFKIFSEGAEEISQFSLKDKMFNKVFQDFEERDIKRVTNDTKHFKVPFCIDKLDEYSYGGPESGEIVLFTGESGVGKSQFLVHYAIQTARLGGDVAYFQIEGTERQIMDRMDAAWTGSLYHDVKKGEIEQEKFSKFRRILNKIKGEVHVEAFEKFKGASNTNIKNGVRELKKHNPNLRLVCIDYLELLQINDGIKYSPNDERFRQSKIGKFLKELAMEENVVVATVTQASNLASEYKKDPNFVMTREYLSEDKGKIRPFDFHFTINQTFDESKAVDEHTGEQQPIIRIFIDKMREYLANQVVTIITNFKRARFYDRKATIENIIDFEDEE